MVGNNASTKMSDYKLVIYMELEQEGNDGAKWKVILQPVLIHSSSEIDVRV